MLKKIAVMFFSLIIASCGTNYHKSQVSLTGGVYNQEPSIYSERADAFKVGVLLPLSGKSSVYGIGLKNASMMALEDANNQNLVLKFFDTQSSPQGATEAIKQALDANVNLVLGPLMGEEVLAISDKTLMNDVPVISFSTSPNVLKEGVYTLGLLSDEQVKRVISYAASKQRSKIAILVPDTKAGLNIAKSAVLHAPKYGANVVKIGFYPANTLDFAPIVKSVTDYDKRSEEITKKKKVLEKLANDGDLNAAKELKMIKNVYTTGEIDFDTVLIAETGSRLKSAAVMFGYYDLYYPDLMFLGTSVWENTSLNKETTLYHGIYPVISRVHNDYFVKKYENLFGATPNQIYSFAYDGVALASALANKRGVNIFDDITDKDGYIGINGAFRILKDGTNEHSMDIVEVTQDGPKIVDKALGKFNEAQIDNVNVDIYPIEFPKIFGKDETEVKEYIYGKEQNKSGFVFN
ncbi:MAG: penicillin-binding protein activator [Alphaproteobacteria bacterium]|nr:penicillin-binding protein activator [Alphaproteobacteria bacterium]